MSLLNFGNGKRASKESVHCSRGIPGIPWQGTPLVVIAMKNPLADGMLHWGLHLSANGLEESSSQRSWCSIA